MGFAERITELLGRLGSYRPLEVIVELAIIWIVVYAIVRFVQGTRAAGALKGLLLILVVGTLIVRVLGAGESFQRVTYLYDRALAVVALALVVVFQPELRRALIRLGEGQIFSGPRVSSSPVAGAITGACTYLAKSKFGALVVVERQVGLKGLIEGGTTLNAELTERLLQTIFYPGSALHDLAVVVRAGRVQAAGVQLPMADPTDMPDPMLGSRHRAAVGVTKESDAIVVVVSEETGLIRIAERGRLSRAIEPSELEAELLRRLGETVSTEEPPAMDGETTEDSTSIGGGLGAAVPSSTTSTKPKSPVKPSGGKGGPL